MLAAPPTSEALGPEWRARTPACRAVCLCCSDALRDPSHVLVTDVSLTPSSSSAAEEKNPLSHKVITEIH